MGNRLLSYAGDIPGINLPDRVELATELGHFVDGPPLKSGRGRDVRVGRGKVGKSIENILLESVGLSRDIPASVGSEGGRRQNDL